MPDVRVSPFVILTGSVPTGLFERKGTSMIPNPMQAPNVNHAARCHLDGLRQFTANQRVEAAPEAMPSTSDQQSIRPMPCGHHHHL